MEESIRTIFLTMSTIKFRYMDCLANLNDLLETMHFDKNFLQERVQSKCFFSGNFWA
jgi:hypothetical protein